MTKKRALTAQEIWFYTLALPVSPLRAAVLEALSRHDELETSEIAELMHHDERRKAFADLTQLRILGYVLSRSSKRAGNQGRPPTLWRLSAKGKRALVKIQDALSILNGGSYVNTCYFTPGRGRSKPHQRVVEREHRTR